MKGKEDMEGKKKDGKGMKIALIVSLLKKKRKGGEKKEDKEDEKED